MCFNNRKKCELFIAFAMTQYRCLHTNWASIVFTKRIYVIHSLFTTYFSVFLNTKKNVRQLEDRLQRGLKKINK